MPRGDRTGPRGFGPMTGRQAGYCAGTGVPGYTSAPAGRGAGIGFGGGRFGCGGRGFRHWFYTTGLPGWMRFGTPALGFEPENPAVEKQRLASQAQALERELDAIRKRLDAIDAPKSAE